MSEAAELWMDALRLGGGPLNDLLLEGVGRLRVRSLEDLGSRSGVPVGVLVDVVRGEGLPDLDVLARLSAALAVPLHVLVYRYVPEAFGRELVA